MSSGIPAFWRKYLAGARLDLRIAAYTKVGSAWNDDNFVPDYNRFYFIMEGEGYLKIKDRTFYPKPGQMYLLPANIEQSYGTVSDDTFGKHWCHFTAKLGEVSLFQLVQTPPFIEVRDPQRLVSLFEKLVHHYNSDELTSVFHANAIMLEIIALYIEQSGDELKLNFGAEASFEKLNDVFKHIERHIAEEINIRELAQIAHFHPNYFIRVFKELTGQTPIQYINRQRIEKAKNLLLTTEHSISEIADSVGIQLFYFSRMFQEQTGLAPTAFRSAAGKK